MLSSQLRGALVERTDRFTEEFVESLRKDFLILMRNLKRVDSFDKAEKLRAGMHKWETLVQEWMRQIRLSLEDRGRDRWTDANSADAQSLLRTINKPYEMLTEIRDFPLYLSKKVYNYKTDTHDSAPKEMIWKDYQREVKKWETRTRKKSRDAWKWLKDAAAWMSSMRGGSETLTLSAATPENMNIEGFSVQVVGADTVPHDEASEAISKLRESLKRYKQRAMRVFPLLIRKQLPLKVFIGDIGSKGSKAGEYKTRYIALYNTGYWDNLDVLTKTLAHEMGHHMYKAVLSRDASSAWDALIRGDSYTLDLRDVLAMVKPGERDSDFEERLKLREPEMYLRIRGLYFSPEGRKLYSVDRIRDYVDGGGDPKIGVQRHPITAYANSNPEEAFCETLGMLVAYGPRTVPAEVRSWFQRFFPQLRIESIADQLASALRG